MLWSNHHDWPTWCATNGHCEVNTAVWPSDHSAIPLATIWILRRTVSTFTWRYFEYVVGLHTAPRPSFVVWEYIRTMTGLTYSAHEIPWFLARMHFQPFLRHTRFLPVKFGMLSLIFIAITVWRLKHGYFQPSKSASQKFVVRSLP